MHLLEIKYRSKVYHRRDTCGGMDSEPAGSSIDDQTYNVVIADDSDRAVGNTLSWFENDSSHLENFEVISSAIICQVNAILRKPITNLNLN